MIEKLHAKLKELAPEYDAIINIAAIPRNNPLISKLTDGFELFDEYERIKRYELYSSLLTAHLAAHHLSPDGYILFKSQLASFNFDLVPKKTEEPNLLTFVANSTVSKQALDLATDRTDEQIIYLNASVNLLMS